jgi:hypothetical protein
MSTNTAIVREINETWRRTRDRLAVASGRHELATVRAIDVLLFLAAHTVVALASIILLAGLGFDDWRTADFLIHWLTQLPAG